MDNVIIITDGKNFCGNGFIIRDGFALTNSHVLRDKGSHFIYEGEHLEFIVIQDFGKGKWYHPYDTVLFDYALIGSTKFILKSNIPLRETEVIWLEKLSTVAYAEGVDSIHKCTGVANIPFNRTRNTGSIVIENGNTPIKGNSGCPVIDGNSNIVGLFVGFNTKTKIAYFIKISYILSSISIN